MRRTGSGPRGRAGRAILAGAAATFLVGSVLSGVAGAQGTAPPNRALAGRVRQVGNPAPGRYIVTLKGAAKNDPDSSSQQLTKEHGGQVFAVYHRALQGYAAKMSPGQAAALGQDPNVATVRQDGVVHATVTSPQTPTPSWGIDRINQHNLPLDNTYTWGADGHSVHAYIIDTGIQTNLTDFLTNGALPSRATFGFDWVGDTTPHGTDCNGHGTHVSGTLGGTNYGVAKMVQLVELRVLDCQGNGFDSDVISAVDWVNVNGVQPAVVNMSLGGGVDPDLDTAIQASMASGFGTNGGPEYAIAAGNDSADACNFSPSGVAFDPQSGNKPAGAAALVAGATDTTDTRASFSNFGSCVRLFAPGVSIVSDATGGPATIPQCSNVSFCTLSGTSMATPHAAGTAALYLDEHTSAKPAEVAAAVTADATANVVSSPGPNSPNLLDYTGAASPALTTTGGNNVVHLSWTLPSDGGSPIMHYRIRRGTSRGGETLLTTLDCPCTTTYDDNSAVNGNTYYYEVGAVNAVAETLSNEQFSTPAPPLAPADYFPVPPTRVLDTRNGTGHLGKIPANQPLDLSVVGASPFPSTHVEAVVMNVTVTNPDSAGWLIVSPAGQSVPLASNLNFSAGETVPNLVTVKVATALSPTFGGKVTFSNGVGNTDVVADVVGYYDDGTQPNGGRYEAMNPTRILDTRHGTGLSGQFGPGQTRNLTVSPSGSGVPPNGVPADVLSGESVQAVILNVTVTNPSAASWLTIFPADTTLPVASNLNFSAGETVPNLVMVKVPTSGPMQGQISIFNHAGNTDVVADVVGYFDLLPAGKQFTAVDPARILDTRFNNGLSGPFGPAQMRNLPVEGVGGVPSSGVAAVVMNTTVTNPTAASWLTLFPANGTGPPVASNLNFSAGETVPNLVTVTLGTAVPGNVSIYNNAGNVDVVADVEGYFS